MFSGFNFIFTDAESYFKHNYVCITSYSYLIIIIMHKHNMAINAYRRLSTYVAIDMESISHNYAFGSYAVDNIKTDLDS